MAELQHLINDLPDPDAALRFLSALEEKHPADHNKLKKNDGLLSDVLTLASYSPLLATTLVQNPDYLSWLNRERRGPAVRTKEELLESLGRFGLTNSQLDLHAQLSRFRRRELLRIFLSDIRRLTTMAEITEDISNLADAILETALRRASQDNDNRFGSPLVIDNKGRQTPAAFCIVSLGKLGSKELNYSSDIDLLFLYSGEGETSGSGSKGSITNREYFIKLSEMIVQLVGKQTGEGGAYRVDMRLRPHGRVGPLAISLKDAVRYYTGEARDWERQVLIRSRSSAGDPSVFRDFFEQVEPAVFSSNISVESALASVRLSKQMIDRELKLERGFNVKLGRGGIREIEFIAQALQLAYGGKDRWLRAPHTLISLARLADRGLITEPELTELFNAYEFLRHLEHILQMENGLQTHTIPDEANARSLVARRMRSESDAAFEKEIEVHTTNVHRIFERVFDTDLEEHLEVTGPREIPEALGAVGQTYTAPEEVPLLQIEGSFGTVGAREQYYHELLETVREERDFRHQLGAFRRRWMELHEEIRSAELKGSIEMREAKRAQTSLAEASIDTALELTRDELNRRCKTHLDRLPITIIGLGKLGGGAVDYGSDLDLVLVHDASPVTSDISLSESEFYSRLAEIFVTTLSSMTRDGSIYRIDLRLRPYGKNGQSVISASAFANYMRETAAIWEWLAYVKIRAVAGDVELGKRVERSIRETIHARASNADPTELASETLRVRRLLEKEKSGGRRSKDIDIKYGSGGMLDVYFTVRFLQLRDNVPDSSDDRSTEFTLSELKRRGSLSETDFEILSSGYRFLASLDHNLRLTVGRTTRLPLANLNALETSASRMRLGSVSELLSSLTIHRLNLRKAFEDIVV